MMSRWFLSAATLQAACGERGWCWALPRSTHKNCVVVWSSWRWHWSAVVKRRVRPGRALADPWDRCKSVAAFFIYPRTSFIRIPGEHALGVNRNERPTATRQYFSFLVEDLCHVDMLSSQNPDLA